MNRKSTSTAQPRLGERRRSLVLRADRLAFLLSKHWLFIFIILVALYVGLPWLAPVFMHFGLEGPGRAIYTVYSVMCHQFAFRSWFLFGPQANYPRPQFEAIAQTTDFYALQIYARSFIGNPQLGYKVALCERDVAIYGALLLGGLLYAARSGRIRRIHWIVWVLIGVVPIGLDGFSQLFSNPPFYLIPVRESTALLRTLTGGLFGLMTAWLVLPGLDEAFRETRETLAIRFGWE